MDAEAEFDIWGSIPFSQELTSDPLVQEILLATRTEPISISEIAHVTGADRRHVENKIHELARWDLLVPEECCPGKWVGNMPVYTAADLAVSEDIGSKYAEIEADILRSFLPGLRKSYESCEIAVRFPWEGMSLIVVGALLADLCVYDRVRFFPEHLDEKLLPPLHSDGTRWGYVGYEKQEPRFRRKRWAFCQNLDLDVPQAGGLATFGYFDPPAQRQPGPGSLLGTRLRTTVFSLAKGHMSIEEIAETSSLNIRALRQILEDWKSCNPPALSTQDGKYSLSIPILPHADLKTLVDLGDKVAEAIHTEVTIPWQREREEAGSKLGLRFPMAEGCLARDIALRLLVEEGGLSGIPDPPVPWSFGVWGWHGTLSLWQDVTRERK